MAVVNSFVVDHTKRSVTRAKSVSLAKPVSLAKRVTPNADTALRSAPRRPLSPRFAR